MAKPAGGFAPTGVGQFIKDFGKNLWGELQSVLKAIGSFFTNFFSAAERIGNSIDALCAKTDALVKSVETSIQDFHDFKFDPKWKTRVINVPIAIDQVRDFVTKIPKDMIDKFKTLAVDLRGLKAGLHDVAGQVSGEGGGGTGLIKVIGWMSLLDQTFGRVDQFVDELQVIVTDIDELVKQIESLDTLFLQQGNARIRLKKTISAREGKLHP